MKIKYSQDILKKFLLLGNFEFLKKFDKIVYTTHGTLIF
jgi:hypothetical protein